MDEPRTSWVSGTSEVAFEPFAQRITLIRSIAGFGKTTFVINTLRNNDPVIVSGSSSARCFIVELCSALTDRGFKGEPTLEAVTAWLSGYQTELFVLIDDAHVFEVESVKAVLDQMIPQRSNVKWILCSQPSLDHFFMRELLVGEAQVLTAEHLRWLPENLISAAQMHHLEIDNEMAEQIIVATKGWPLYSLRLARVAAQNRQLLEAAIDHVQDQMADFVRERILEELPSEVLDFAVNVAAMGELPRSGLAKLYSMEESEHLLDAGERAGLLTRSTAKNRYDPIVATWLPVVSESVVRWNLHAGDPGRDRLRFASQIMLDHQPARSFSLSVLTLDYKVAYEILMNNWLRILMYDGGEALLGMCVQLPERMRRTRQMRLIQACAIDSQGDIRGAEIVLSQAQKAPESNLLAVSSDMYVEAFAPLILSGKIAELEAAIEVAGDHLHSVMRPGPQRAVDTFVLGWAEGRLQHNPRLACELLEIAGALAEAFDMPELAELAHANAMFFRSSNGDFQVVLRSETRSSRRLPKFPQGWEYYDQDVSVAAIGRSKYWTNDLSGAIENLRHIEAAEDPNKGYYGIALLYRALCSAAHGDRVSMVRTRNEIERAQFTDHHGTPWRSYMALGMAHIAEALGKPDKALDALQPHLSGPWSGALLVLVADLMRRIGQPDTCRELLDRVNLSKCPDYAKAHYFVTRAVLEWSEAAHDQAHKSIEQALDWAVGERVVRPFLVTGHELTELLKQHLDVTIFHKRWVLQILQEREVCQRLKGSES